MKPSSPSVSAKEVRWAFSPLSDKPPKDGYKKGKHLQWINDQADDFFLMPDVKDGAGRIAKAIQEGEVITLSGDYDCDGNCATAIMRRFLLDAGVPDGNIRVDIPNRELDGYGFNLRAAKDAKQAGTGLIITLDNGTKAHDAIKAAMDDGMDVLVIDHHPNSPNEALPAASDGRKALVVNPCRADTDKNKFSTMAAAGVTLLMTQCVHNLLGDYYTKREPAPSPEPSDYIGIASLATVADVVDVSSNINRTLVRHGLDSIKANKNKAITAMAKLAGKSEEKITSEDIAFSIAPRINASGRLGQSIGWELLSSATDPKSSPQMMKQLQQLFDNKDRQRIEADLMPQAQAMAQEQVKAAEDILFVGGKGWHEGVIGIVAGRIKEEFGRPVIAYSELEDGRIKCSARNLKEPTHQTDLGQAFRNLAENGWPLSKAGGHVMAAGASLEADNLERFKQDLRARLNEPTRQMIEQYRSPVAAVVTLRDDLKELVKQHEKRQPFGEGNPRPRVVLASARLMDGATSAGAMNRHQVGMLLREENPDNPLKPNVIKANAFHIGGTALETALNSVKGRNTNCLFLGTIQADHEHPSSLVFHIEDMVTQQHRGQSTAELIAAALGKDAYQALNQRQAKPVLGKS